MANVREIVRRRKSIQNIVKITRTMEMIATARFRQAQDQLRSAEPYYRAVIQLVSDLIQGSRIVEHPLQMNNENVDRTIILALTSNRGLCGGFNGNVIRLTNENLKELRRENHKTDLRVSGKKGIARFRFLQQRMTASYTGFDEKTTFADVERLANELMLLYSQRRISTAKIVYTRFYSAGVHRAEVKTLLPLQTLAKEERHPLAGRKVPFEEYEFFPSAHQIVDELIPTAVRVTLYDCFLNSLASEQAARMAAMQAASDNGGQMIDALTRSYNRLRQGQITGELLDIIGGVEALK